jgi:hypothetical protein
MNTANNKLKGEVDAEQITAWKDQYKEGIYQVLTPENNPTHVGYFRNPTREDVNYALSQASAALPLAAVETFVWKTCIGGSDEIGKDEALMLGVINAVREKMNGTRAKLVNL